MNTRTRVLVPLTVAGVAALALPWGGAATADQEPGFSGYTSTATATAVRLEIFEPSIPIPAEPQMEVHFAYSKAVGDSGSTKGRASFVWPGDPIGEGLKTVVEQAGLPPQLGQAGYPMQVNSAYPTGPESEAEEPTPGSIMRTSSGDGTASAQTGFSADGEAQEPEDDEAEDAERSSGVRTLQQFGQVITGQPRTADAAEEEEPETSPAAVPDPLSTLIDFGGYLSTSRSANADDGVTARSRAALGDVSLLGGLVTMSGLDARSLARSDGAEGEGIGEASYGTMTVAGVKFRFGPDGFEAAGSRAPIPGLPDDPVKALKALGISMTFPEPTYEIDGDKVVSTVAALELQVDLGPLTKLLNTRRLNDVLTPIADRLPDSAGPLKSMLTALGNLAPRFVLTLASARTTVDTVQGIDIPEAPPPAGPETPTEGGPGTGPAGTGTGGNTGAPPAGEAPPASTGGPMEAAPDLVSSTPGLPELFSIPGMLMVGGLAAAGLLGTYVRKLGLLALGGGGACAHGLVSGLPDLRKVT